ncbi:MAG: hypothetical protein D6814_10140 [Calditrichaeota bacterium]|nr:MAG: hypothetical protein D6814_10140 [Calditrichota bacterium]
MVYCIGFLHNFWLKRIHEGIKLMGEFRETTGEASSQQVMAYHEKVLKTLMENLFLLFSRATRGLPSKE